MQTQASSKAAEIRTRVGHPIIDSDGHVEEIPVLILDYIASIGGAEMRDLYAASEISRHLRRPWDVPEAEVRDRWIPRVNWWGRPTANTLDRATAMSPRLLYERLDELGIDFAIIYPSEGLFPGRIADPELRRVVNRAYNAFMAEAYREFSTRLTPAAAIPMLTPEEAIAELEFAVRELGFKTVVLAGNARRPIPAVAREHPELASLTGRMDFFGLDSVYDYDPVWAKCVELQVAPTFHSSLAGHSNPWMSATRSISNYVYNHIGNMAASQEALCKALFLGGVTRRFPTLRMAFLECGVAWACALFADLIAHWEKRGAVGMRNVDPARLDVEALLGLLERAEGERITRKRDELRRHFANSAPPLPEKDDFWRLEVEKPEELYELFAPRFYFGCEADDAMNVLAFNRAANPFGARLRTIFGSDISHWDVPDMAEVVEEAYEPVERAVITPEDFRDFVFVNPVRLHAGMNPDFFRGTVVETEVARLMAAGLDT
jgi:predicted TIM-barrel fold metal-dependent hydrolase